MPKTIRLDQFRYISNESWRALIGIEMGLKNHELVPPELALKISRCRRSSAGFVRLIREQLISNSLVAYETDSRHSCSGYRLTNLGYDYLALRQLFMSGQLSDLGSMIGAGKESDVYIGLAGSSCGVFDTESEFTVNKDVLPVQGDPVVVKFHRLGRTSFRKVKEKRDYHEHRTTCNWLYLDRLASQREFMMMQAKEILEKIVSLGLVHGDFNEFNLMVADMHDSPVDSDDTSNKKPPKLVLIDFPQMISRDHELAEQIYQRDAQGMLSFFSRYFDISESDLPPESIQDIKRTSDLDVILKAPGYSSQQPRRRHKKTLLQDSLIGAVAHIHLSSTDETDTEDVDKSDGELSSNNSDDDDDDDDDNDDHDGDEEYATCEEATDSEDEEKSSVTRNTKPTKSKSKEASSSGVISQQAIRERHRRERRQKEQAEFQRRIKRRTRAETKKQGRNSLKAEVLLFG